MAGLTPVFVNVFNRLSYTKQMVEYLMTVPDCEPIIIDNCSTYEPLLEWYNSSPCRIVRLDSNLGHIAPWVSGVISEADDLYVVTDPDLDLTECPIDILKLLEDGLVTYDLLKCGLSIRIDDLPDTPIANHAAGHERQFWRPVSGDPRFFHALVDTTFAIYSNKRHPNEYGLHPAMRSAPPYTCRHLPWYITPETATEEDLYYLNTKTSVASWWGDEMAKIVRSKQ